MGAFPYLLYTLLLYYINLKKLINCTNICIKCRLL